ncbi:MAG: translocation/assembly module TamB domain-containing protein, partial [Candidatus Omnitrophica bacterium]|nr:translocation/assembly module TamB domain-containing protein [Candidatus Omnitrophota bacterium]
QRAYENGEVDVSVYANESGVASMLDFFAETSALKRIIGTFKDVDIDIKGSFLDPEIQGSFFVTKLSMNKFLMTNCMGKLDLKLTDIKDNIKINGDIALENGQISGPKTAIINLGESKIIFTGSHEKPSLELRGTALVEDVNISILLKGTFEKPDLKITSKPVIDQDRILLMLATNKTWKSAVTAVNEQELSTDIAKDFLDYFIFSGTGNKMAEKYGIRDILVSYDGSSAGIGAKKDITANTAITYSVAKGLKETNPQMSQKVGAEYAITTNVMISGEKEIKMNNAADQTQNDQKSDDNVMLKFKKDF